MVHLYLKTENSIKSETLNFIFNQILKSRYEIEVKEEIVIVSFDDVEFKLVNLRDSFQALEHDLGQRLLAIISPIKDEEIEVAIKKDCRYGIYHLCSLMPEYLQKGLLKIEHLKSLFNKISDDMMLTIKTYVELNMSINLVAYTMYTHRNTINYRINRFIEMTGIDIRNTINGYFVYLIITWN